MENNRLVQKRRIMKYFIEAAQEIMDRDGIEGVTAKKVSELAGYNSATIYNYFENLEHLVFFASVHYLRSYALDVPNYTKNANSPWEIFIKVWECFSDYSFANPYVYNLLFFSSQTKKIPHANKEYYKIFPEEAQKLKKDLIPMFMEDDLYLRNLTLLKSTLLKNVEYSEQTLLEMNEMILLIYQGMLQRSLAGLSKLSAGEAKNALISYLYRLKEAYKDQLAFA